MKNEPGLAAKPCRVLKGYHEIYITNKLQKIQPNNLSINDRLVHSLVCFKSSREKAEPTTTNYVLTQLGFSYKTIKATFAKLEAHQLIKKSGDGWVVDQLPEWIGRRTDGSVAHVLIKCPTDACEWNWTQIVTYWLLRSIAPSGEKYGQTTSGLTSLLNLDERQIYRVLKSLYPYASKVDKVIRVAETPDDWWQEEGQEPRKTKPKPQAPAPSFVIQRYAKSQDEYVVSSLNSVAKDLSALGYEPHQIGDVIETLESKFPTTLWDFIWHQFPAVLKEVDQKHHSHPKYSKTYANSFGLLREHLRSMPGERQEPIVKVVEFAVSTPEPVTMKEYTKFLDDKLWIKKEWEQIRADIESKGVVPPRIEWDTIRNNFWNLLRKPKEPVPQELKDELKNLCV